VAGFNNNEKTVSTIALTPQGCRVSGERALAPSTWPPGGRAVGLGAVGLGEGEEDEFFDPMARERVLEIIRSNKIVLFMKGNRWVGEEPQAASGFSVGR
jgi:hypothetical protein